MHESDITPGLANKIASRFAKFVCTTFPETVEHFPPGKAIHTGTPIRQELFTGSAQRGKRLCGFTEDKPAVLVMGGSLGAVAINNAVRAMLDKLTRRFNVIHICGSGNYDSSLENHPGYKQFEYVSAELPTCWPWQTWWFHGQAPIPYLNSWRLKTCSPDSPALKRQPGRPDFECPLL